MSKKCLRALQWFRRSAESTAENRKTLIKRAMAMADSVEVHPRASEPGARGKLRNSNAPRSRRPCRVLGPIGLTVANIYSGGGGVEQPPPNKETETTSFLLFLSWGKGTLRRLLFFFSVLQQSIFYMQSVPPICPLHTCNKKELK